ncbi:carboxypeptidase regulatory-like domain-containing protein [Erythrobacter sp. NE805]|uniref:carboxypeptidase regulatory-like domain-containing protein n=1 Tax=Erythrobacter sp. NE805 TaxID=3389875 RepID=UPI00396B40FD
MIAAETLAALLIGAGALAAAARLVLALRGWRGWALAALSLASGALLTLALFPPRLPIGGETLLVATADTASGTRGGPGERLVALPEAPRLAGAERVPDLATALRRYPQVRRIRVLGRGLTARDRDADAGLPVEFRPLPPPRGLVRLDPPADTTAGSAFVLAGEAAGLAGGTAELLDPAGRRVDSRAIGGEGSFTLGGTARTPGLARFTLRLRGRDRAIVSDTPVPLRTLAERPLRVLLIGAPSPEAKYLRRWLEDAGAELKSSLAAGGGIDLGGEGARLDPGAQREADVVVIDDTALAGIGVGGRAALARAVADGLGVVVRMTGPATAGTRSGWRALGLSVEGGSDIAPVALAPRAPDPNALTARRGPGTEDVPGTLNTIDDPAPDLGRWVLRAGPDLVPAVSDADGALVAGWQQHGEGRVALWALANSFALVLSGEADRYEQWWSETLSAVARPDSRFRPEAPALVQVGERMAVCGIGSAARLRRPDGQEVPLAIDPDAGAGGCAATWPSAPGVHTIVQAARGGEQVFAFLVLPEGALRTVRADEDAAATTRWAAEQGAPAARGVPERRGPAWPWFLGWLAISGALWFAERRFRAVTAAG